MRDSNLEFRIVDPGPSNFGYAAIISLESGLLVAQIGVDLSAAGIRGYLGT